MLTIAQLGSAEQIGGVLDVRLELRLALHSSLGYRVFVPVTLLVVVFVLCSSTMRIASVSGSSLRERWNAALVGEHTSRPCSRRNLSSSSFSAIFCLTLFFLRGGSTAAALGASGSESSSSQSSCRCQCRSGFEEGKECNVSAREGLEK